MTLPFAEPINGGGLPITTGAVAREDAARSARTRTRSGNAVRTAERSGHPLDVPGWRQPVIGDFLWSDSVDLGAGGKCTWWLIWEV